MRTYPEVFPQDRRADPKRRAEGHVFDTIRNSGRPGFTYYEWKRNSTSLEIDFAIWLLNRGRIGLQVKGGPYCLENGKWYLTTPDVRQKKPSPVRQTWDATMSLRNCVEETLGGNPFFVAVLLFPDMEPDPDIIAMAGRSNAHLLFGTDNLMDRLEEIAAGKTFYPPTSDDIAREVAAVTSGQIAYDEAEDQPHREEPLLLPAQPKAPTIPQLDIATGSITIQHVETLIVHTAPGPMPYTPMPYNGGHPTLRN